MQENVQRWIGSWLDSRRRPKKKEKKNTSRDNSAVVFFHHLSLFYLSLSLSCPLSFLSPFWHPSSCPTIAPTYVAPSLYKRARATTCFLLSPPLDRVQRVPLHNPFDRQPTDVISHAIFPPLFSYVSLSPMRYNIRASAPFPSSFSFLREPTVAHTVALLEDWTDT